MKTSLDHDLWLLQIRCRILDYTYVEEFIQIQIVKDWMKYYHSISQQGNQSKYQRMKSFIIIIVNHFIVHIQHQL